MKSCEIISLMSSFPPNTKNINGSAIRMIMSMIIMWVVFSMGVCSL